MTPPPTCITGSVPVDYIVSGDKDLTDLKVHAGIPILTYNELLAKL